MRLTIAKLVIRGIATFAGLLGFGMLCITPYVIQDAIAERNGWMFLFVALPLPLAAYFIYAAYLVWSGQNWAEETERLRPRRCWVSLAVFFGRCLWWRRRVVLAVCLICVVATVVITWVQPRVYSSRVRIAVRPVSETDVFQP